ncbi:hypothetical protein [uncultured Bacteroides sp.]|uniref:hypothetical protein n=1 Tax=uncultured Bacteroides sp. TaxID=162156 RepID=UPI0025FB40A0|nr:hypothetical protein [uncultured Bacteroides sp.]
MQTTTAIKAGNAPDLLSGILSVQVRNEDKITKQDRIYCQNQQEELYKTLDQIAGWYNIFKAEADKYEGSIKFKYEENGSNTVRSYHDHYNKEKEDYTHHEFKPFQIMNELVCKNHSAVQNFINRIIGYFNNTYNVSVESPEVDEKTLPMGFRPVYSTYVDVVIEHLGGKSFRDTAEDELIKRFLQTVRPSCWSKVKPELKKDKIIFPDIVTWDSIHYEYHKEYDFEYESDRKVSQFCEGIAFGADDVLCGSIGMIMGLDTRNVDISRWYDLTTTNALNIKFYAKGRIDVRFKDSEAAESCFKRLRLDEITLREN